MEEKHKQGIHTTMLSMQFSCLTSITC